jgi:anti-sigma B factor antagonist
MLAPAMLALNHQEIAAGAALITVSGDLMLGPESEKLPNLVRDLLREGKRLIVFDISGVDRIDSTGIGRFIASYNQIAAAKGEMRLAGIRTYLFHVFQVSSLDKIFHFYPTVEEALNAHAS